MRRACFLGGSAGFPGLQQHRAGAAGSAALGGAQLPPEPRPAGGTEMGDGGQAGGLRFLGDAPRPSGSCFLLSPAGIALIMWNALYTAEKVIIRWTLLTEACYFAVQFLGEWQQPPGVGRMQRTGVHPVDPTGRGAGRGQVGRTACVNGGTEGEIEAVTLGLME